MRLAVAGSHTARVVSRDPANWGGIQGGGVGVEEGVKGVYESDGCEKDVNGSQARNLWHTMSE